MSRKLGERFLISAAVLFAVSALLSFVPGLPPLDLYIHDVYFVLSNFHLFEFGGFFLAFIGAVYFFMPARIDENITPRSKIVHCYLTAFGLAGVLGPLFILGNVQRTSPELAISFAGRALLLLEAVSTVMLLGAQVFFAGIVVLGFWRAAKNPA